MSYYRHVLQEGEHVKHVSRVNGIVYLGGVIWLILGAALLAYAYSIWYPNSVMPHFTYFIVGIAGAVCVLVAILRLIGAFIRVHSTEMVVTDRRIIIKRGFIMRHTAEMNMDKVESVDVDQGFLGRIFNFGTVTVRGTGASLEPFSGIASPLAFRNAIMVR